MCEMGIYPSFLVERVTGHVSGLVAHHSRKAGGGTCVKTYRRCYHWLYAFKNY